MFSVHVRLAKEFPVIPQTHAPVVVVPQMPKRVTDCASLAQMPLSNLLYFALFGHGQNAAV